MAAEECPKISDIIASREANGQVPFFSFEFFPPRTPAGVETLYQRLNHLKKQGFLNVFINAFVFFLSFFSFHFLGFSLSLGALGVELCIFYAQSVAPIL